MKNFRKLGIVISLVVGILFVVSCEKSDVETETNQINDVEEVDEGFKSTTGNNGEKLKITESETIKPVLKMHFTEGTPKEEAMLKFDAAAKEYISKQPTQLNKGFSTEWYYRVWVRTGTQTNNQTDGPVGTYTRFTTSVGGFIPPFNWMSDAGNSLDGGWDGFLFRAAIPGQAIEWVEVDSGSLYLYGTDGWFVTNYVCQIWESDQTVAASGFSGFWTNPNVWLDNPDDTWDSYYSNNIGSGRLTFD